MAGGKVVLSESTFTIAAALQIPERGHLGGQGKWATTIQRVGDSSAIGGIVLKDADAYNIALSHFNLDGRKNTGSPASGHGLVIDHAGGTAPSDVSIHHDIYDIAVRNWKNDGIRLLKRSGYVSYFWMRHVLSLSNDGIGVYVDATDAKLVDVWSEGSGLEAWFLDQNGGGSQLLNCKGSLSGRITAAKGLGIVLKARGNLLSNCFFQDNADIGMEVRGRDNIITGGSLESNGKDNGDGAGSNQEGLHIYGSGDSTVVSKTYIGNRTAVDVQETGIVLDAGGDNCDLEPYFGVGAGFVNKTADISDSASGTKIRGRGNHVTENSGTGEIANATTSDVITHGLSVTPSAEHISVTLKENPTNTPGAIWVDTITATQFTVNCENDPGASGLDFGWKAIVL